MGVPAVVDDVDERDAELRLHGVARHDAGAAEGGVAIAAAFIGGELEDGGDARVVHQLFGGIVEGGVRGHFVAVGRCDERARPTCAACRTSG